jgi:hypothetical protein
MNKDTSITYHLSSKSAQETTLSKIKSETIPHPNTRWAED